MNRILKSFIQGSKRTPYKTKHILLHTFWHP